MVWRPHASEAVTLEFLQWCAAAWAQGERLPYVITPRESDDGAGYVQRGMSRKLAASVSPGSSVVPPKGPWP